MNDSNNVYRTIRSDSLLLWFNWCALKICLKLFFVVRLSPDHSSLPLLSSVLFFTTNNTAALSRKKRALFVFSISFMSFFSLNNPLFSFETSRCAKQRRQISPSRFCYANLPGRLVCYTVTVSVRVLLTIYTQRTTRSWHVFSKNDDGFAILIDERILLSTSELLHPIQSRPCFEPGYLLLVHGVVQGYSVHFAILVLDFCFYWLQIKREN